MGCFVLLSPMVRLLQIVTCRYSHQNGTGFWMAGATGPECPLKVWDWARSTAPPLGNSHDSLSDIAFDPLLPTGGLPFCQAFYLLTLFVQLLHKQSHLFLRANRGTSTCAHHKQISHFWHKCNVHRGQHVHWKQLPKLNDCSGQDWLMLYKDLLYRLLGRMF